MELGVGEAAPQASGEVFPGPLVTTGIPWGGPSLQPLPSHCLLLWGVSVLSLICLCPNGTVVACGAHLGTHRKLLS